MAANGLVLGTAQWGSTYGIANRTGPPGESEIGRMLNRAAAAGVTTLDTARAYGASEALIGRLAAGWRVVTKVTEPAELEASRAALGREMLDVALLHDMSAVRAWDALRSAKASGLVARVGVSADTPEQAAAALEDEDVEAVQVAASLLDQRLVRADFFERASARGVEVFVRSIYLQGVAHLPTGQLPPHLAQLREPLEAIRGWARARGLQPADPFVLFARSLGAQIVIGCESFSQLEDNLRAFELPALPADETAHLAALTGDIGDDVLTPSSWPAVATRQ